MTTALTGPFPNVPCHGYSDLAYMRDKTVSADSCYGGSSPVVSEGPVVSNDGSLSGSETSLVESSRSLSTEFMSAAAEESPHLQHHLGPAEGHIAVNLPESRYMYHLAFDSSLCLDLDRNLVVEVGDVKSQSEVAFSSTADVSVAEAVTSVDEEECAMVDIGAEETDVQGGPNSSAAGAWDRDVATNSVYELPLVAEAATVVSHVPPTSTSAADLSNGDLLAITGNSVSEPFDEDHAAAVRMPSEPDTCITIGSPVMDIDSSECKHSHTDLEERSSDCVWEVSPSDVGEDDKVRDRGAGGVSRVIPVTSVQHVNSTGNVSVEMSAGSQAEVRDRDPGEDDEECFQSTAVSASGEDLLVLVNFRITADRYEGASVASETRESVSRIIVRQSDVLPKMKPSCFTSSDWADMCSTENRQFYLVRKMKTNVELSGERLMMTSADNGRSSDVSQTNWYGRGACNTAAGRMRQVADQSVTKTTRVMKHVVVTKSQTTTNVDDAAENSPRNVYTGIGETGGVDKEDDSHAATWMTKIVRRSRLKMGDSGDSGASDVAESGTTDYLSLSDNYEREDIDGSFSSGLEEVETSTDMVAVDTTLVLSSDDNTETTEITASDLNRTALDVGLSEAIEITEHKMYVEFPDDDKRKRSAGVKAMDYVDNAQSVDTGVNVMADDDGHEFDSLKEVKTGCIRMMSEACTETHNDDWDWKSLTCETQSTACQTDSDVAHFQQLQQQASAISVGLQTSFSHADATTSTAELMDEDSKPSADNRLFGERDIIKTTQTDEDISDAVITVHEAVDRINILSTAVQTDPIDSVSLFTVETQTGSCETSIEPRRNADQDITADVHTLTTVDVAVVETQTLPWNDTASATEAQTSTAPVDLVSTHTQTIERNGDVLMADVETCTTPVEVSVTETQTSLDEDRVLTAEAQTSTDPVDLEGIEARQLEYKVTVEDETCMTPVDVDVAETQTSPDIISAAEAQTCVTPVDLVMVATQTVWTDEETDDDNVDHLSHLRTSSIDVPVVHVPQIDQLYGSFPDILLQAAHESEVTDSSYESIYLEDYSSSAETLYTDVEEDYEDVIGPDGSLKTDSDKVDDESVSEDLQSEPSESEYTDASIGNVLLEESDSAGHIGVPQVETCDLRHIPTSLPGSPVFVYMEQQPVSPDAGSTRSQVRSFTNGYGDGTLYCFITNVLMHLV